MQETLTFILPPADVSAHLSQVGGKGASLARMAAAGLPVPPGFHVTTTAYRRFVEENGLPGKILSGVTKLFGAKHTLRELRPRNVQNLGAEDIFLWTFYQQKR